MGNSRVLWLQYKSSPVCVTVQLVGIILSIMLCLAVREQCQLRQLQQQDDVDVKLTKNVGETPLDEEQPVSC